MTPATDQYVLYLLFVITHTKFDIKILEFDMVAEIYWYLTFWPHHRSPVWPRMQILLTLCGVKFGHRRWEFSILLGHAHDGLFFSHFSKFLVRIFNLELLYEKKNRSLVFSGSRKIPTLGSTVQWETRQASFTTETVGPRIGIFLSPLDTKDGFYLSYMTTWQLSYMGRAKYFLSPRNSRANESSKVASLRTFRCPLC